jgi:DNA repair protein RecO (recombination protein O)
LYWKDGRGVQTLGDTALLDGYPAIKRDLERNAYAAFPLEVAYKAAHENEPSGAFFAALVRGMESLTMWRGNARDHAAWQVLQLLSVAGFAPMLDACSHCGGELPEAPGFAWDHGAVCARCPGDKRLRAETFAALRAWCAAADVCPEVAAGVEAFMVVRHYAARHLDSDFRSVRVIDRMFGV